MALVAMAVAVATSTACTSDEPSHPVEDEGDWGIDTMINQAEAADAGPEQMAALEEAKQTGRVPFEVYNEAIDRALRCIRESGGSVLDRGVSESEGMLTRSYSVETGTEAADPVEFLPGATVHRCIAEHSIWVEAAYENQPSAIEAEEAFWKSHRKEIVTCLRAEGVDVAEDEPVSGLKKKALEAYNSGDIQIDCVGEVLGHE